MRWQKNRNSISVQTPAKLNLFLEVLGRRADGFHDLQTVICAVDRFDELQIIRSQGAGQKSIELECRWAAEIEAYAQESAGSSGKTPSGLAGDLPPGEENLVFRAASLFLQRCDFADGLEIKLVKSIPSQAGLGGASGNAAGTLLALNEMYGHPVAADELCRWSAELGSDIPFFMEGTYAICEGRGEKVTLLSTAPQLDLVVVKPDFGLSTPAIFSQLEVPAVPRSIAVTDLAQQDFDWSGNLFNRLQQPAEKLFPQITQICDQLLALGCRASLMTGSGSSCYGICESREQAREIGEAFSQHYPGFVFTCRNLANFSVRE